jgi:uncharacterized membrane protein YfcA
VATTPANTTTYSDTGLAESTTYFYRIRSFNGSNDSDFSVEASAATRSSSSGGGGGCFIATAAFGLPLNDQVVVLKDFRARFLLTNRAGMMFVRFYNQWSPPLADFIRKHEAARIVTRCLLYPLLGFAYIVLHTSAAQKVAVVMVLIFLSYLMVFRRRTPQEK